MKEKSIVSILGLLTGATILTYIPAEYRIWVLLVALVATWVSGLFENPTARYIATFMDAAMVGACTVIVWDPLAEVAKTITIVSLWVIAVVLVVYFGMNKRARE